MDYVELNLTFSEEDMDLKKSANKFALEVMRPIAKQLDQMTAMEAIAPDSPFWTYIHKAFELGYHKILFPEAVGGVGLTPLQLAIVYEELAWGSFGLALTLAGSALPAATAFEGSEELVKTIAMPYINCTDGSVLGCWAITEPDHGSDTLMPNYPNFRDPDIKASCRARLDGDEYVISGQKAAWVSCGTLANQILLMAQIDSSKGHAGSGIFVFSLDRSGVSKGKPLSKVGTRDLNQGEVYFDEVRVPKECLIHGPEDYENALEAHLCLTTPLVGMWCIGLARAAFDEALAYARGRVQGGKPLADHPTIQLKLYDMFRKIEAARHFARASFVYNWSNPPAKRSNEHSFAAKTFASQVCLEVTSDAIQILGGNGISKEYLVEKLFRDARCTLICDGCTDTLSLTAGYKVTRSYPRQP